MIIIGGMISQPLCQYSLGQANKFCVHPDCKMNAFICKHCSDQKCQNAHIHDGLISVKKWSTLSDELGNTLKANLATPDEHRLVKHIKDLITNLTKILENYTRSINELRGSAGLQPNVRQTLDKLRSGNTVLVTGADMKDLVEAVCASVQDANRGQMAKQLENENQRLFGAVSKYIEDFVIFMNQHKEGKQIYTQTQTTTPGAESSRENWPKDQPQTQTVAIIPKVVESSDLPAQPDAVAQSDSQISSSQVSSSTTSQQKSNETILRNISIMKFTKIKDIPPGQYNMNIVVKIVSAKLTQPNGKNKSKKFIFCVIGDQTGICDASFESSPLLEVGAVVYLINAFSKVYKEHIQVQLMKHGSIVKSDKKISEINRANNISDVAYEKCHD